MIDCTNKSMIAGALAAASLLARASLAQEANPAQEANMEDWSAMRGEVVRAQELLGADVTTGFNPLGKVTDLILSENGSQVQYVLYEVPYPYSLFGGEDGFVTYDNLQVNTGATFNVELQLRGEEAARAPQELTLTRDQAEERMVSRLIGERMAFEDGAEREIEDILIDRDSGAITHYVVETDEDSIFRAERRTVPASRVRIDEEGEASVPLQLSELEDIQDYEPGLL